MKRFLAAILSLALVLTALCAVAVSADETYPKEGTVTVYYEGFENYADGTLPSNWSGGNAGTVSYKVKVDSAGNHYLWLGDFNADGLVKYYFTRLDAAKKTAEKDGTPVNRDTLMNAYYVRFVGNDRIPINTDVTYTSSADYVYAENGKFSTTMNGNMVVFSGNNGLWYDNDGEATKPTNGQFLSYPTGVLQENGWFHIDATLKIISFSTTSKDEPGAKDPGWLNYGLQMGSLSAMRNVGKIVTTVMNKEAYKDLNAYNASSDICKAAVDEIKTELAKYNYEARMDNLAVTAPAKIYQDTVKISGGSAVVTAKTDGFGVEKALRNGDTVEVNDAFGTVYTIKNTSGVIGRVKYNEIPVYFAQNGDTATVTIPAANITKNGTLEVVIAQDSEYVTNTYTANFVGGVAENGVANPSLTSTDGRVTFKCPNLAAGATANNVANSAEGTFAFNDTAIRKGLVFNKEAENPLYYASGRTYGWKLFFITSTYTPAYLQWSNPWNGFYKSLKDGKTTSNNRVNASVNGPSGNGVKGTENGKYYVYNSNSEGKGYIGYFAKLDNKNNVTAIDEYGYAVPGNIEILNGIAGVFNGFEYSETVMMHKISFDGEGTLKVSAPSLNNFEANKCNATLTTGQSAKVEDLMKADFTVAAPENKVIDTIKYVTFDGETSVGAELVGKQSGSFSIQPVEASGTIKVTYKDNTPAEPKVEYSSSNVEHNKTYTVDGTEKISAHSIVMYGTVTGEFDAYGFILSQFGEDSVKTGEVALKAATKSADGRFAIRVVGDAITLGSYKAAPYSEKNGATEKGTETDITITAAE